MQIPRLPVSGENLKKYILDTLRGILDYLKATRLVEGDGISIRETPSGVIVSATRKGTAPGGASGAAEYDPGIGITITGGTPGVPEKINANITGGTSISVTGGTNGNPLVISYTGGGGGTIGIDSSVSGGTASVYLSGGTGSVKFVGRHGVYIAGGSAGEILIEGSTSGGGGGIPFPDYAALTVGSSSGTVLTNGSPFTATSDGWLRVSIRNDGNLSDGCFRLSLNGADIGLYQYRTNSPGVTKFIYIPSGTVVQYSSSSSSSFVKFAPGIGGGGLPAPIYSAMTGSGSLSTGTTYTAPANGWLRVSIRNDGNLSDGCFRLYFDNASIGFYQYRTGSCGITDFLPVMAGTEFRFETSSSSYYVKFDHAIS